MGFDQKHQPSHSSAGFTKSTGYREDGALLVVECNTWENNSSPSTMPQLVPSTVEEANVNYRAIVQQGMPRDRAINLRKFEHNLKKAARAPANPPSLRHGPPKAKRASQKPEEARYVKVVHKRVASSQSTNQMANKQKVFSKFSVPKGEEIKEKNRRDESNDDER